MPPPQTQVAQWSRERAIELLNQGISSEDSAIRAEAYVGWFSGNDASVEDIRLRAANDPSSVVQRALTKAFPGQFAAFFRDRSSSDGLALAWLVLAGEYVEIPDSTIDDSTVLLIQALQADEQALNLLLERVSEGDVPADPDFFDIASKSRIAGMGQAMLAGLQYAEDEVKLSMALTAMALSAEGAASTMSQLLKESQDPADAYWVVEAVVRGQFRDARDWLLETKNSSDLALELHFRLGLMGLGDESQALAVDAIQTGDRDTRGWAIECLGMLFKDRPMPREMITILEGSARDETEKVRVLATRVLVDNVGVRYAPIKSRSFPAEPDRVSLLLARKWLAELARNPQ